MAHRRERATSGPGESPTEHLRELSLPRTASPRGSVGPEPPATMILGAVYRLIARTRSGRWPARATAMQIYGPSASPTAAQEAAFFGGLRLANGTFKTTNEHRLDDLNLLAASVLPKRRPLRVKDVGISSGVTTIEWAEQLRAAGIEAEMTGADLSLEARLVRVTKGIRVLFDADGNVLQTDLAGYGVPGQMRRSERLLFGAIVARAVRSARCRSYETLKLVSPRLLGRPDVEIVEEDLLAPPSGRQWDLIRAANILNVSYFPREALQAMLAGITSTLASDGVLVICRTDSSGTNNATIFRLRDAGYEVVGRLGSGSEVEDLVLAGATSRPASRTTQP